MTGEREFPIVFNGFKDSNLFYEHMVEKCMYVFSHFCSEDQPQHEKYCKMLLTDVEEKLKLCYVDDDGKFIHANLDILRDYVPVEPEELTRLESYTLKHFIRIQYHVLIYLQQLLQGDDEFPESGFEWISGVGQLLEISDALRAYTRPLNPHATQKQWFEAVCHFMHVKCPVNLNQELQKKRSRYVPTRFLQVILRDYTARCQRLK